MFVWLLVGSLVCQQDNTTTTEQILTKFGWRMSPITHNWFKGAIYTKPLFLSLIPNLSNDSGFPNSSKADALVSTTSLLS